MQGNVWCSGYEHTGKGLPPPHNSRDCSAPVDANTSQHEECVVRDLESAREKVVGKPYEGEPHVRFDVAGAGDVAMVELCTHSAIERAELETLHLQQARLPSTLPEARGREQSRFP